MRKIFFVWCATLLFSASLSALELDKIKSANDVLALPGNEFYSVMQAIPYDGFINLPLTVTERFKILNRINPPLKVSAKSWPLPMDSRLKKYPVELQRDWRLYRSLSTPFAKLVDRAERQQRKLNNSVAYLANRKQFWQLVEDLATDKKNVTAEDFLRYELGSWCGTMGWGFAIGKSKALTVAFLKEQRGAEAVGALLMELREIHDNPQQEKGFVQRAEFLTLLADGWDWHQLAFGGLLAAEIGKDEGDNHRLRKNCLLLLTASGGEREARQLLELSRSAPAAVLPEYLTALTKLVTVKKNAVVDQATQDEIAQFIRSQESR